MKFQVTIGRFLGFPILVHATVLLIPIYLCRVHGFSTGLILSVYSLALLIAHEMGHAWFAKRYNHKPGEIMIYPFHGHCSFEYDARFALEPLIHAGGLIVQLVILAFWSSIQLCLEYFRLQNVVFLLEPATYVFVNLNIWMLVINALPIPGLDGFNLWICLKNRIMISKKSLKSSSSDARPISKSNVVNFRVRK